MNNKKRQPVSENDLNQMQWYLGEETVEDYQDGILSRRAMLKRLIVICGGSAAAATVLAACGVPANAPVAAKPAEAPAATVPAATNAAGAATPAAQSKSPLSVAANDPTISTNDVTFAGDVDLMGYLAKPAKAGTYPGVIVIHENRGLTAHIKDVVRRLAKAGYVALAPDLVSRAGGTAKAAPDQIAGLLGQAKPEELVKDLSAGVDYLLKQSGVKPGKVGVVGFCFGGAYTLRLAAANPVIGAAVSYYGPAPQPVSQMTATNAAILGQYGAKDARVNGTIPDMEKALKDAGKTFEQHVYEGAGHAFNNDTGANYNEQAAVPAWQATLDWFAKYL